MKGKGKLTLETDSHSQKELEKEREVEEAHERYLHSMTSQWHCWMVSYIRRTGSNSRTKERNGRAAYAGWDKGCSHLQLAQFLAALGLVYLQYKGNAERATNVEEQHPSIHHELGMKITGAATLATALAVEGGLGSVLRHAHDSSYALNTILCINSCFFSVLWPCCCIGKLYENSTKEIVETCKSQKHLNSNDISKA